MPKIRVYKGDDNRFVVMAVGWLGRKRAVRSTNTEGKKAAKDAIKAIMDQWDLDKVVAGNLPMGLT